MRVTDRQVSLVVGVVRLRVLRVRVRRVGLLLDERRVRGRARGARAQRRVRAVRRRRRRRLRPRPRRPALPCVGFHVTLNSGILLVFIIQFIRSALTHLLSTYYTDI